MANLKNFTAKTMEEKLKHGWTTSDFAKYFECSEDDFISHMQNTLSTHAFRGFSTRLKRNQKHQKRNDSAVDKSTKNLEIVAECNTEETQPSPQAPSISETLDVLEGQKKAIEATLNEEEIQHKALCSDRLEIRKTISEYKDRLIKLKQEVHICQTDITSLLEQLDEKQALMEVLNLSIASKRSELEHVKSKIDALQSVVVFVYSSGDIEIEAQFSIEIPDWKDKFNVLVCCDDAGSLTLNQLKALAKILTLTQFMENQNWKYDLMFDNDEMEIFYSKVRH